jgi:hypothetical protein
MARMSQNRMTLTLYAANTLLRFRYTNYKLETENRRARVLSVWYGSSEFHQGEQWFLMARDVDRDAIRHFAMRDMSEVSRVSGIETDNGEEQNRG